MDRAEIERYVETQSPWRGHPGCWYQEGLELPHGVILKSACEGADCRKIWDKLHLTPEDIQGKTILDIGCNTGYYAMRTMEEGAKSACGLDNSGWIDHGRQFAEWKGLEIEWRNEDFADFSWRRTFDLVFALQVLYHLGGITKDPLSFVADACNETLVLFTKIRSEKSPREDPAYIPTLKELEKDLAESGFAVAAVDYIHKDVLENVIQSKANMVGKVAIKAKRNG